MALTRINGRNGTANMMIGGTAYASVIRSFNITSNVGLDDVTTLSTETAPVFDPQIEILRFDFTGFLTYGASTGPGSGPLIPAPQGVAMVFTYYTGCTISGSANMTSVSASRAVGTNSVLSGSGTITGAFVVTWATT